MSVTSPPLDVPAGAVAAHIRLARADDLDALVTLEERAFQADRISRRSFRRLLPAMTALCLVAVDAGRIIGYALLLFRRSSAVARLYSIAVDPQNRGKGIGAILLAASEKSAYERGADFLRLEVREDNIAAIALYRARGYRRFGRAPDYYEDRSAALRFEKRLAATVTRKYPRQ